MRNSRSRFTFSPYNFGNPLGRGKESKNLDLSVRYFVKGSYLKYTTNFINYGISV